VVGFATTAVAGDVFELEDLFVDPDWTRQGIASDLVHDVVRTARAHGAARIEVTANDHAGAFYEHVGFVRDGAATTQFGPAHRMHLEVGPPTD
jgi:GNAT superfamily N-acetyltransferase